MSTDSGDSAPKSGVPPKDAATLAGPARDDPATATSGALSEGPGTRIGQYKLLQLIGEGGFGSVFLAQQEHPVQRKVALKVIKLGMDTRQVVARFEQERQALAILDHPNIAKVFDAGATDTGRPFFVMELCTGEPIDAYSDRHNLSLRQRLELFALVCSAVQHAHTKGLIHRDIKPSNILVSALDDGLSVKVIDFGIAKATASKLTEKTVFTQQRELIGTPEYMSPEQAEGSMDIDTRTDVYSLGVLLYQLLTGTTPFRGSDLHSAAYAEIQRIIREVDPPRPSTRLSENNQTVATIAAHRRSDPGKLRSALRGELDWIVMKCLEKERSRRYETANGLALDVRRYLAGESVHAAPPSAAYRTRKFIRRNRAGVAAAAAVGVALIAGAGAFAWQANIARGQRDRAVAAEAESKSRADELQQVADFQAKMLGQIDANDAGEKLMADLRDRFAKALEKANVADELRSSRTSVFATDLNEVNATDAAVAMIDRTILKPSIKSIDDGFKEQPLVDASLRTALADLYKGLGLYREALELQEKAAATRVKLLGLDDERTLKARDRVADLYLELGRIPESLEIHRETCERSTRLHGPDSRLTLTRMSNLGNTLRIQSKFAEAEPLLRQALDGRRRALGNEAIETLISLNTYGQVLIAQGRVAETEPYWREAQETGKRVLGPDNPDTLIWTANMGGLMGELGRPEDALKYYTEAYEGFRRVRGEEHPYTLACLTSASQYLGRLGRLDEAADALERIVAAQRRTLGPENPSTLTTLMSLGTVQRQQGKLAESVDTLRTAVDLRRKVFGTDSVQTIDALGPYADSLYWSEREAEALPAYREQLALAERNLGPDHPLTLSARSGLGNILTVMGRLDEAEPIVHTAAANNRRVLGPANIDTSVSIARLGLLLRKQGKLEEAEVAMREALTISRVALKPANPRYYYAMTDLAGILLENKKLDEAEQLIREALVGLEKTAGPDALRTSEARRMLGRVLTERAQFIEAEKELLRAHHAFATSRGTTPTVLKRACESLRDLYTAWHTAELGKGYDAKAAEWKTKADAIVKPTPAANDEAASGEKR
jgi:eukaryotic-like serine/threonine-protein kinase